MRSLTSWVRKHWFLLGVIGFVALKHSILAEQPFVARSGNLHDDTLFLSQAFHILAGDWLGPYNQLTLLRGPFYPLWISFVYTLGMPLIHANDLLYLGACLLTMRALRPLISSRLLLFVLFILLYFAPHSYDYATISHAFRMQIYSSLVLLLFSAALGLGVRLVYRSGAPFTWALMVGLFFSFFWYTREEGVWVLPALVLLVLFIGAALVRRHSWSIVVYTAIQCLVIPGLVFLLCTSGLMFMNQQFYGAAVVRDVKAKEFKHAYDGLLRIKPDDYRPRVPVTRKTLQKLYKLSPKMQELKPYLENTADKLGFAGEFPSALFIFSFRDATAAAGYYRQGADVTLAFFDGLGDELEALCREGQVECGSLPLSMVPLWRNEFNVKLPGAFFNEFYLMVRFPEFNVLPDGYFSYADGRFLFNSGRLTHSLPRVSKKHQWDALFPDGVKEVKVEIARTIGNGHQIIRPVLFLVALVAWLCFTVVDLRKRKLSFLNGYMAILLVGLSALATALAIIEVTSFHMLFRPRHGGLPLVILFIACALVEWRRRRVDAEDFAAMV